jgi:hypothetical protein
MSTAAQLTLVPRQEAPEARSTLRALVATVEGIADAIEALDPNDLDPETRAAMSAQLIEALAGTREKVDRTAGVLAMFEHLEAAAAAECKRLKTRTEFYARQRERLETYVLAVLQASNIARLDGETSSLQAKKNPPSVVIVDEDSIPTEYLRWPEEPPPPPPVPDKKLIAQSLKADPASVPGCRLEQGSRLVRS